MNGEGYRWFKGSPARFAANHKTNYVGILWWVWHFGSNLNGRFR